MNLQELKTKERDFEREKQDKIAGIRKEYAKLNDLHELGDVITDHCQTGRIISKKYHLTMPPCMVYYCHNLTKKGEINKKEPVCNIYQSNIESKY